MKLFEIQIMLTHYYSYFIFTFARGNYQVKEKQSCVDSSWIIFMKVLPAPWKISDLNDDKEAFVLSCTDRMKGQWTAKWLMYGTWDEDFQSHLSVSR